MSAKPGHADQNAAGKRRAARVGVTASERHAVSAPADLRLAGRVLSTAALFLLLVIIGLRPLVAGTYDSAVIGISARLTDVNQPTPLANLVMDGVILLAAALVVAARVLAPGPRYRRTGLEIGAILLTIAGVLSCAFAGNKRLAINGTIDWLCLPLLTILLVQIVQTRWQVRLLVVTVLASAAVQAAECWNQSLYEFAETRRDYFERKEQIWGPDADPAQVELFEHRMRAAEATGYLEHSNVTAGYLLLTGIAAVALAAGRWRAAALPYRRGFAVVGLLLGIGMCATLPLTGSYGSMAALGAGVVVLIVVRWADGWIEQHRKQALLIGWGVVGLGIGATVGLGLARGTLPHPSLAFRWQYWKASAQMFAEHPLAGVGRENFGRHYLQYKRIESPEEVANPHNFLVQAACAWGVLGLAGMVALLVGGSLAVTRRPQDSTLNEGSGFRGQELPLTAHLEGPPWRNSPLLWALALGLGIFIPRLALLGSTNSDYLTWETGFAGSIWLIAFFVLSLESDRYGAFLDDPLPGVAMFINVGLFAFLLQDTINFALFVPGAATAFFALLAVPIVLRAQLKPATRPLPRIALAAPGLALIAYVALTVAVWRCQAALSTARAAAGALTAGVPREQPAYRAYERAAKADALDPTPPLELSRWLLAASGRMDQPGDFYREARDMAIEARRRDPFSLSAQRQLAAVLGQIARASGDIRDCESALNAHRRLLEIYPQNPQGFVELAEAAAEMGAVLHDKARLRAALDHYTHALELDNLRGPNEIRRFTDQQRAGIRTQMARLQELIREN
ncbi:MAG TPA: O-antigen ligase family protein [Phycisphaerae bacterium]